MRLTTILSSTLFTLAFLVSSSRAATAEDLIGTINGLGETAESFKTDVVDKVDLANALIKGRDIVKGVEEQQKKFKEASDLIENGYPEPDDRRRLRLVFRLFRRGLGIQPRQHSNGTGALPEVEAVKVREPFLNLTATEVSLLDAITEKHSTATLVTHFPAIHKALVDMKDAVTGYLEDLFKVIPSEEDREDTLQARVNLQKALDRAVETYKKVVPIDGNGGGAEPNSRP